MVRDHIDSIYALLSALHSSSAAEIEISEGNVRIRVRKPEAYARPAVGSATEVAANPVVTAESSREPRAPSTPDTRTVRAPMFGVFHRASAPGADAFVQLGSRVKRGDQLCVIESMKVFSAVAASIDGVIEAIHVDDGMEVTPENVLFTLGSISS